MIVLLSSIFYVLPYSVCNSKQYVYDVNLLRCRCVYYIICICSQLYCRQKFIVFFQKLIAFFQKVIAFFQKFIAFFQNFIAFSQKFIAFSQKLIAFLSKFYCSLSKVHCFSRTRSCVVTGQVKRSKWLLLRERPETHMLHSLYRNLN